MIEYQLRSIYSQVGEISSIWNQIEEVWYLIFTTLVPGAPRAAIDAIYNQFQSFAAQRQMLQGVADAVLDVDRGKLKARNPTEHLRAKIKRNIGQLNAKTNFLAGKRNAIIHASFEVGNFIIPARIVVVGPSRRSKISDENIHIYLEQFKDDAILLLLDLLDLRDLCLDMFDGIKSQSAPNTSRSHSDERARLRAKTQAAIAARQSVS